jgi:DNA-binding NarL/FixJ family response regulator
MKFVDVHTPSGQHPNRKRVLIVDDHPMTRSGHQPDFEVCGEAESAAKALSALEACEPDLALVDITLPDKSGLELIKNFKALRPGLPILVISMHDELLYAERRAGSERRGNRRRRSN